MPRPCCSGGSDAGRSRVLELVAPRRVGIPGLRPLSRRRRCGWGVRYAGRAQKLTPADESAIRILSATKSLRALAAEFGVNHKTMRAVSLVREVARFGLLPTTRHGPEERPSMSREQRQSGETARWMSRAHCSLWAVGRGTAPMTLSAVCRTRPNSPPAGRAPGGRSRCRAAPPVPRRPEPRGAPAGTYPAG